MGKCIPRDLEISRTEVVGEFAIQRIKNSCGAIAEKRPSSWVGRRLGSPS